LTDRLFVGEAPGRVNLIGEHTDYNGGFVLPAAIPQRTRVELRPRDDDRVFARSENVEGGAAPEEYVLGLETPGRGWLDYIQGLTRILRDAGYVVRGFDIDISSDVPVGSGLSSSAALEIALLRAAREAFSLAFDDVEMAILGRRAENEFVGAPVGIMDQMACTFADEHHALFLDTRTLQYERVALPEPLELVVIDSGVAHHHAAGDYRTRRAECEEAATRLGVRELRDCGMHDLVRIALLPEPLSRRARHVVTENARVLATVDALHRADLRGVGLLFNESHASMRDDFEVSIPEIDALVTIARRREGVYGARLTGGGFGGSIIAAVRAGAGREVADLIAAEYAAGRQRTPTVLVPLQVGRAGTLLGAAASDEHRNVRSARRTT
jgi:galactokinase